MKYIISTTVRSGDAYRACVLTGNTRKVETATMFSSGEATQSEVKAFRLVHPDDVLAGMETVTDESLGSRPVGIGAEVEGLDWI